MDDFFRKPDSFGNGSISGGTGWGTHIHESKDALNPWFSIKVEKTNEHLSGWKSPNEHISSLLPDWMRK